MTINNYIKEKINLNTEKEVDLPIHTWNKTMNKGAQRTTYGQMEKKDFFKKE